MCLVWSPRLKRSRQLAVKLESLIPELLELNAPELIGTYTVRLKAKRTLHAA